VVTSARSSFPERNWSGQAGLDCRGNLGCRVALGIGIESAGCSLPHPQRSPPQPDIQATLGLPCPTRRTPTAASTRWPCWVRPIACSASASWTASSARDSPRSPRKIDPAGSRPSELAHSANMSPQAMGELVDKLESPGYVVRRPDPRDRAAKLIMLTRKDQSLRRSRSVHHQGPRGRDHPATRPAGTSSAAANAREAARRRVGCRAGPRRPPLGVDPEYEEPEAESPLSDGRGQLDPGNQMGGEPWC
jgi:hypothetical protein